MRRVSLGGWGLWSQQGEVGKWRPGPQALEDPVGASGSRQAALQHWPLAVKQRVKALKIMYNIM